MKLSIIIPLYNEEQLICITLQKVMDVQMPACITSYEVIIVSRHSGYELGGQYIEPAETYPSSSQWGTKGWTFTCVKHAEAKLTTLKEAEMQKK